jgi:hypothetical protein
MKAKIWLAWRKLNGPADRTQPIKLPVTLPARLASVFAHENILAETIAWAAPCISVRGPGIPANLFGALVATSEEPHKLIFVARKGRRPFTRTIDLEGSSVSHESGFLFENLLISTAPGKRPRYSFIFPRPDAALVEQIVSQLRECLHEPALHEQEAAL